MTPQNTHSVMLRRFLTVPSDIVRKQKQHSIPQQKTGQPYWDIFPQRNILIVIMKTLESKALVWIYLRIQANGKANNSLRCLSVISWMCHVNTHTWPSMLRLSNISKCKTARQLCSQERLVPLFDPVWIPLSHKNRGNRTSAHPLQVWPRIIAHSLFISNLSQRMKPEEDSTVRTW